MAVENELQALIHDLKAYRAVMDRIFSRSLARPRDCRKYFLNLLICVTRLYLDYLTLSKELSRTAVPRKTNSSRQRDSGGFDAGRFMRSREHALSEARVRWRFKDRLNSLQCWEYFQPEMPFSELTGLRTRSDYFDSFTLHLPEIYEETIRAEKLAGDLLAALDRRRIAQLIVSLQHFGQNHIIFVLPSLQCAADEMTWRD